MKFDIKNYSWNNLGSIFDLESSPGSNICYRVILSNVDDQLTLTDFDNVVFDYENTAPYLKNEFMLNEEADRSCSACHKSEIYGSINGRVFCKRHYENEEAIARMSIRDFLYSLKSEDDYNTFMENYNPYQYNHQDLKFPCLVVLHRDYDHQYDEELFTAYFLNGDME